MIQRVREKIQSSIFNGDNKLGITSLRYLPRWLVLFIDTFFLFTSIVFVYFVLTNMDVRYEITFNVVEKTALVFGVNFLSFFIFKTYSGIVRHSTFTDILKIFLATFSSGIVLTILNYGYLQFFGKRVFYFSEILLFFIISFSFLFLFRLTVKQIFQYLKKNKGAFMKKRVVILGTEDDAISIAEALSNENNKDYEVVGFMSNEKKHRGIRILNKPVIIYNGSVCSNLEKYSVEGVLVTGDNLSVAEKNKLVDDCISNNIQIYNVPKIEEWNDKKDLNKQIKAIQIEDLLNRKVIDLDDDMIREDLQCKNILITGGAGSIGSEMVRQVAAYNPKKLVILDQAETALHAIELEINEKYPNLNYITELADISNTYRLSMVFEEHDFDVIYHAAAYKHVPLIERNPHEAIYVNIGGTINLAKLAVKHKVDKFVMVSTDKAVNPTNVMGASKRAAEIYVQSLQQEPYIKTKFITTRFGNVLGSNGSVIPHFKAQIAKGGPVTVTHPDIIRYFMTIPEACQLVLQAGTMGDGGEIYVFDMGKPVRIMDLAERMIRLSGLLPNKDINIEVTGLRPGEKLFEELLADNTVNRPTHHKKIMIAKETPQNFKEIKMNYKAIIKASLRKDDDAVVRILKDIVVEYKSENSKFVALDK